MTKKKKKSKFDLVHATVSQVKEVKSEIARIEKMLADHKNPSSTGYGLLQDEAGTREELNKKVEFLRTHTPDKFKSPAEENRAYARANKLKQIIIDAMPNRRQYYQAPSKASDRHSQYVDKEKAIQQQIKFQTDRRVIDAVNEYKHIMRRIDPNDPTITNIELLRP